MKKEIQNEKNKPITQLNINSMNKRFFLALAFLLCISAFSQTGIINFTVNQPAA
jgi:hypothetical protein